MEGRANVEHAALSLSGRSINDRAAVPVDRHKIGGTCCQNLLAVWKHRGRDARRFPRTQLTERDMTRRVATHGIKTIICRRSKAVFTSSGEHVMA
jgi:hypothetical protein